MANRCGDCDYLNYNDTKWGGEKIWCNKKCIYTRSSDAACSEYTYHGHRYGRYLITVACEILGVDKEKEKKLFKSFDLVRDEKTPEIDGMYEMINDYDIVGPAVAEEIKQDPFKEYIATCMMNEYILPSLDDIEIGNYGIATTRYIDMVDCLFDFYFKKESNKRKRTF